MRGINHDSRPFGRVPPSSRGRLVGVKEEKVKERMKVTQKCFHVERDGGADGSNSADCRRGGERSSKADHLVHDFQEEGIDGSRAVRRSGRGYDVGCGV